MSWGDIIMKCKVSPEFLKSVRQMLKLQVSGKDKSFPEQQVLSESIRGYRAYKELTFLSEKQFVEKYKMTAKEAQVPLESLVLHNGEAAKGVLIDTDAVVKVQIYGDYHSFLSEVVMNGASQLRADQGLEEWSWHAGEVARQRPRGMMHPWSPQGITQHIEKQRSKRQAELEQEQAMAELAPQRDIQMQEGGEEQLAAPGPPVQLNEHSDSDGAAEAGVEGMEASVPGAVVCPKKRRPKKQSRPSGKVRKVDGGTFIVTFLVALCSCYNGSYKFASKLVTSSSKQLLSFITTIVLRLCLLNDCSY